MPNHLTLSQPSITWPSGDEVTLATFTELCIYEDINRYYMSGYLIMHDAGELSSLIVGGEKITFSIESPLEDGDINQSFIIYAKDNEEIDSRGVRLLKVMFISEEALSAQSKRLCKRWDNNIPSIIQDIFESLPLSSQPNGNKTIDAESATTTFDYIAPNISADQVIKTLLPLCYDDEGYPFVVFENTRGIHIKSIKTLFDGYNKEAEFTGSDILTKVTKSNMTPAQRSLHLESCQIYRNNDVLHLLNRSSLSSKTITYDFNTREQSSHDFLLKDQNPYDGSVSFNQFDQTFMDQHGTAEHGQIDFEPIGDVPFYKDLAQKKGFRRSIGTLTGAVRVEFEQPHSLLLQRVGECVNLSFDNQLDPADPERRKTLPGQRLAGRYLITKVAHMFRQGRMDMGNEIVEAMKLGYGEAV